MRSSTTLLLCLAFACSGSTPEAEAPAEPEAPTEEPAAEEPVETNANAADPVLTAEDFGCITELDQVGRVYIKNVSGHLDQALAVARSEEGGDYPVGTVLQLIPNEAMVKRAAGFSAETHDWEVFALDVSAEGTTIS